MRELESFFELKKLSKHLWSSPEFLEFSQLRLLSGGGRREAVEMRVEGDVSPICLYLKKSSLKYPLLPRIYKFSHEIFYKAMLILMFIIEIL